MVKSFLSDLKVGCSSPPHGVFCLLVISVNQNFICAEKQIPRQTDRQTFETRFSSKPLGPASPVLAANIHFTNRSVFW